MFRPAKQIKHIPEAINEAYSNEVLRNPDLSVEEKIRKICEIFDQTNEVCLDETGHYRFEHNGDTRYPESDPTIMGPAVNEAGYFVGWTLLHNCALNGELGVAKWIIENQGGDVNICADHHTTPLFEASGAGQIEMMRYLIEHGANVDMKSNHSANNINTNIGENTTPLHYAVWGGNVEGVELLLEHKCDSDVRLGKENKRSAKSRTALELAVHLKKIIAEKSAGGQHPDETHYFGDRQSRFKRDFPLPTEEQLSEIIRMLENDKLLKLSGTPDTMQWLKVKFNNIIHDFAAEYKTLEGRCFLRFYLDFKNEFSWESSVALNIDWMAEFHPEKLQAMGIRFLKEEHQVDSIFSFPVDFEKIKNADLFCSDIIKDIENEIEIAKNFHHTILKQMVISLRANDQTTKDRVRKNLEAITNGFSIQHHDHVEQACEWIRQMLRAGNIRDAMLVQALFPLDARLYPEGKSKGNEILMEILMTAKNMESSAESKRDLDEGLSADIFNAAWNISEEAIQAGPPLAIVKQAFEATDIDPEELALFHSAHNDCTAKRRLALRLLDEISGENTFLHTYDDFEILESGKILLAQATELRQMRDEINQLKEENARLKNVQSFSAEEVRKVPTSPGFFGTPSSSDGKLGSKAPENTSSSPAYN